MNHRWINLLTLLLLAALTLAPAFGADQAATTASVIEVNADGSGVFADLQTAIDEAKPGSVIQLGPGVFKTSVVISKPLTLQGAGWDKTRLEGHFFNPANLDEASDDIKEQMAEYRRRAEATDGEQYEAILREMYEEIGPKVTLSVRNATNVAVKDLTITLPGPVQRGGLMGLPAVLVVEAQAKFADIAIVDSAGDGMHLSSGATAEIDRCLFAGIRGTGLQIRKQRDGWHMPKSENVGPVKVRDCDFRTCGYSGIYAGEGAQDVQIKRCRISRALFHGIYHHDASPTIEDCLIFDNRRNGVYVRGETDARIQNNVLVDNGISANEEASDTIKLNTFYGGATEPFRNGIFVAADTKVAIHSNVFLETGSGIATYGNTRDTKVGTEIASSFDLEGNLFWRNHKDFSCMLLERGEFAQTTIVDLDLPPGNTQQNPGLVNPAAGNFAPREGSAAERMKAGARPVIEMKSRWPVQPEEKKLLEALGKTFD